MSKLKINLIGYLNSKIKKKKDKKITHVVEIVENPQHKTKLCWYNDYATTWI